MLAFYQKVCAVHVHHVDRHNPITLSRGVGRWLLWLPAASRRFESSGHRCRPSGDARMGVRGVNSLKRIEISMDMQSRVDPAAWSLTAQAR
jgi:hypothetical protein